MGQEGSKGGAPNAPGAGNKAKMRHSAMFMDASVFDEPKVDKTCKQRPKSQGDLPQTSSNKVAVTKQVVGKKENVTEKKTTQSPVKTTAEKVKATPVEPPAEKRKDIVKSVEEAVETKSERLMGNEQSKKGNIVPEEVQKPHEAHNETGSSSDDEFLDAESGQSDNDADGKQQENEITEKTEIKDDSKEEKEKNEAAKVDSVPNASEGSEQNVISEETSQVSSEVNDKNVILDKPDLPKDICDKVSADVKKDNNNEESQIDDIKADVSEEGNDVVNQNKDKPGLVDDKIVSDETEIVNSESVDAKQEQNEDSGGPEESYIASKVLDNLDVKKEESDETQNIQKNDKLESLTDKKPDTGKEEGDVKENISVNNVTEVTSDLVEETGVDNNKIEKDGVGVDSEKDNISEDVLPGKAGYTFDFDDLDNNVDPFATKTEIPQTPKDQEKDSVEDGELNEKKEEVLVEDKSESLPPKDSSEVVVDGEKDVSVENNKTSGNIAIFGETLAEKVLEESFGATLDSVNGGIENKLPLKEDSTLKSNEDEIPLSKGAYDIDFDQLDDKFNPFESNKQIPLSPDGVNSNVAITFSKEQEHEIKDDIEKEKTEKDLEKVERAMLVEDIVVENSEKEVAELPSEIDNVKEMKDDLPQKNEQVEKAEVETMQPVEENLNVPQTDNEVNILEKTAEKDAQQIVPEEETPETVNEAKNVEKDEQNIDKIEDSGEANLEPIPTAKGAYNVDFDKLDDGFNPFAGKKEIPLSPNVTGSNVEISYKKEGNDEKKQDAQIEQETQKDLENSGTIVKVETEVDAANVDNAQDAEIGRTSEGKVKTQADDMKDTDQARDTKIENTSEDKAETKVDEMTVKDAEETKDANIEGTSGDKDETKVDQMTIKDAEEIKDANIESTSGDKEEKKVDEMTVKDAEETKDANIEVASEDKDETKVDEMTVKDAEEIKDANIEGTSGDKDETKANDTKDSDQSTKSEASTDNVETKVDETKQIDADEIEAKIDERKVSEVMDETKHEDTKKVSESEKAENQESIPLAKGSYDLDFDKIDDSFNPFATKSEIPMSPNETASLSQEAVETKNINGINASGDKKVSDEGTRAEEPSVVELPEGQDKSVEKLDIKHKKCETVTKVDEKELDKNLSSSETDREDSGKVTESVSGSIEVESETVKDAVDAPNAVGGGDDLEGNQETVGETPKEAETVDEKPAEADLDSIPISKGSYNIDFDNLDDSFNPFATQVKVVNDIDGDDEAPVKEKVTKQANKTTKKTQKQVKKSPQKVVKDEKKPEVMVEKKVEEKLEKKEEQDKITQATENVTKDSIKPVEINLNDSGSSQDEFADAVEKIIESESKEVKKSEKATEQAVDVSDNTSEKESDEIPVPKGAYNFDFDSLDPNFDPFSTKSKVVLSPKDSDVKSDEKFKFEDEALKDKVTFQTPARKPVTAPAAQSKAATAKGQPVTSKTSKLDTDTASVKSAEEVSGDAFEELRELDEKENWKERTTVITKTDHQQNLDIVKDVITDVLTGIPLNDQKTSDTPEETPAKSENESTGPPADEMEDVTEPELDLPVPAKTYELPANFEEMDPFKPRSRKIATSPTPGDSSESKPAEPDWENMDPFKSSKALANTPPGSPTGVRKEGVEIDLQDSVDSKVEIVQNNNEGETKLPKDEKSKEEEENVSKNTEAPKSKKKAGPKKKGLVRRGKLPPPNWGKKAGDSEEIEIFMPGQKPGPAEETETAELPVSEQPTAKASTDPSPTSSNGAESLGESTEATTNQERSSTESNQEGASCNDIVQDVEGSLGLMTPDMAEDFTLSMPDQELFDQIEGEVQFKSAEAVFDDSAWNMLEKCGNETSKDSQLSRESLYVKFDPLVKGVPVSAIPKKRTVIAAIPESDNDLLGMNTPPRQNWSGNTSHGRPTLNTGEVDNLLSVSPQNQEPECDQSSESKLVMVDDGSAELKARAKLIEQQLKLSLQAEFAAEKKRWEEMKKTKEEEIARLQYSQKETEKMLLEYEKTMNQMIDFIQCDLQEKDRQSASSQQSMTDLVTEKNQAVEDLHSVETAFSDLHKRYEKLKATVQGYKKNEETLKNSHQDLSEKLKKQIEKYHKLRQIAEEKLDVANVEIGKVRKQAETEKVQTHALSKKQELQIQSLEQQLQQKTEECKELSDICDNLINKVGK